MLVGKNHKLIVAIVKKGYAENILIGAQKAGARGGTIIGARGVGVHETKRLMGIMIEPEKELLLILTHKSKASHILEAVVDSGKMEEAGTGIGFVLDVEAVVGIVSLIETMGVEYSIDES
jgi:nitrogen regulatory protein PII